MKRGNLWLFVIAVPAGIAMWSGWVTLGTMCGFGMIEPLPGITDFQLNTAITLPLGIEAYGIYAFHTALETDTRRTRRFAWFSAGVAAVLAIAGQVVFHLLELRTNLGTKTSAPIPIVIVVSCVPVLTFGFAAVLRAFQRADTRKQPDRINAQGLTTLSRIERLTSGVGRLRGSYVAGKTMGRESQHRPTVVFGTAVLVSESGLGSEPMASTKTKTTVVLDTKPNTTEPSETTVIDPLLFLGAKELYAKLGKIPTLRQLESHLKIGRQKSGPLKKELERVNGSS